jgi:cytochrome c1
MQVRRVKMVCNGDKKIWLEKPMKVKRVKTVANTKATTNTKTKNIHAFLQISKATTIP